MDELFRNWDGEEILLRRDRAAGAWMIIAVHSTLLGPATGGTRMKAYPDLRAAVLDAQRLAAGMSYKYAAADFPRGGGKCVIAVPSRLEEGPRRELLLRYGELLHQLGGFFQTGPDVGTTSEDMDVIAETGAPHVFSRTNAQGGAGDPGPWTALGVFCAMEATCQRVFGTASLAGRHVLVQGAGSVGRPLVARLLAAGARVSLAESDAAAARRVAEMERTGGGRGELTPVDPDAVFDTSCDVFTPCALGGVLGAETIPRLRCRAVVGAANNQLAEPADAERLHARGILLAPDFVANIGGAMAITGMESMGWTREEAEANVRKVAQTTARVFALAEEEGITPNEAALRVARRRLGFS